jgi:hypothetical protein
MAENNAFFGSSTCLFKKEILFLLKNGEPLFHSNSLLFLFLSTSSVVFKQGEKERKLPDNVDNISSGEMYGLGVRHRYYHTN